MLTGLKIKVLLKLRCCEVNNVCVTDLKVDWKLKSLCLSGYCVTRETACSTRLVSGVWEEDRLIHHASRHASNMSHGVVVEQS